MNLTLIGKALLIAFAAAVAAWLPMAALLTIDTEWALKAPYGLKLFQIALLGSFAIGLPVALMIYALAGRSLAAMPSTIFLIGLTSGLVLIVTSFFVAGEIGVLFLGMPSFFAANTFAVLGWFFVIRPMRNAESA
ncbi:MAG: hypothetical protein AAF250_01345 [Pseudomonadota bacterium]